MPILTRLCCACAALAAGAMALGAELELEIGALRGSGAVEQAAAQKVRSFARNAAELTRRHRAALVRAGRYDARVPFSLPTTLHLKRGGRRLAPPSLLAGLDAPLVLAFDSSGPRAFPPAYRQVLEDTFAEAQSFLTNVFGDPNIGGTIHVRNFDADIGDRDAVAGGYYVPDNGLGEQEIRFPVYSSQEAAAVNFVHTLLLAYLGPDAYRYDAFKEGLVRAATLRVCRLPSALPAYLDLELVEAVLQSTYDVGPTYDWNNQRALGGESFIAPNLRNVPLPAGGSVGGLYLLRYQMAGSAWQKVLVEYPAFASSLNQIVYTTPGLGNDVPALVEAGQAVIDSLAGGPDATLEGRPFAEWFRRQYILETKTTLGEKLLVEPVPIPPIPGSTDFGVFDIIAHYFRTQNLAGDEILLSGTSYPIFWSAAFDRTFPSVQEDRMDIAGAYGSVTPNLPNELSGQPYRSTVDIPVGDRIARAYLPAGAIATGANPTPNDFYGTVIGLNPTGTLRVRLTYGATTVDNIPVQNGAFKARIDTPAYLGGARCRVEVVETIGLNEFVRIDRRFNKGPGPIGLDLRLDNGDGVFTFAGGLPKGLSGIGMPLQPYSSSVAAILGIAESQVLVARWNPVRVAYDIFPDTGAFERGHGYFVRMDAASNPSVSGWVDPDVPVGVALRPGWNLISNPLLVASGNPSVVRAVNLPKTYAEAVGTEIGTLAFEFTPGPNDPATGAPESGTMTPVSSFAPGKMVFVRVLVPEGVTLVFNPPAGMRPTATTSPLPAPRFLMRVSAVVGPYRTEAQIGQSSTATAGFDPREDSGLPPRFASGLQAAVQNATPLFRDVRSQREPAIFTVRFTGLRAGVMTRLRTELMQGQLGRYWYRLEGAPTWQIARGPLDIAHRAASDTVGVQIRVEAGS